MKKWFFFIALECLSFTPYFNIQHKEHANVTKELPSEQLSINKEWEQNLLEILSKTKIDLKKIEVWKTYFIDSLNAIGSKYTFLNKDTFNTIASITGGITSSNILFTQSRIVLNQLAKFEATLKLLYEDDPDYVDILAQSIDLQIGTLEKIGSEIQFSKKALHEVANEDESLLKKIRSELRALKKTEAYCTKSIKRLTTLRMHESFIW